MNDLLYTKVDNSPIIIFRIFFGILMLLECWGAILTGWVKDVFVVPSYTFTFIGFEWTHILLGQYMYFHYFILGLFALMIALGYRYRLSTILFFIGWSLSYFMQKTSYNNHYYLIVLVSFFMIIIPAASYYSLDTKHGRTKKQLWTYRWCLLIFIIQISIVYFFASIAKLYPGWLENKFISIKLNSSADWFSNTLHFYSFSNLLKNSYLQYFLVYTGIFFDLLIVPLLAFKKTRKIAIILSLIFHLFNSVVLQIGIFPYFALSFSIFFFHPQKIQQFFFKHKPYYPSTYSTPTPPYSKLISLFFILYFLWQIYLPLRHWHIPGDVLWTEEGHRLSWRMMLRSRTANTHFIVENTKTQQKEIVNLKEYLTSEQLNDVISKPDMIWQFAQYLEKKYKNKGIDDIKVFVNAEISINGGPYNKFTNEKIDLTAIKWNYWGHQIWLWKEPSHYN